MSQRYTVDPQQRVLDEQNSELQRPVYRIVKPTLRDFVQAFLAGSLIVGLAVLLRLQVNDWEVKNWLVVLSDASFVAGIILLVAGVLSWIRTFGLFDMFGVGFRQMRASITGKFKDERGEDIPLDLLSYRAEYRQKGKVYTRRQRIWVGLFFLLVSVVFAVLSES